MEDKRTKLFNLNLEQAIYKVFCKYKSHINIVNKNSTNQNLIIYI
jgi:hypothetical protein